MLHTCLPQSVIAFVCYESRRCINLLELLCCHVQKEHPQWQLCALFSESTAMLSARVGFKHCRECTLHGCDLQRRY